MTYTWWIHPKKTTTTMRRIQSRINLLGYCRNTNVSGAALNHAEDNEDPVEPTSEQDEREDGQVSPDEHAIHEDSEDSNYLLPSEDEVSLGNKDFIVPEDPLKQERFKRRLIATARSLKKKQQQLQADQDLLNDRWTDVLAAEEYSLKRPAKSYPKRKLLPQFDDEALEPVPSAHNMADR